MIGSSSIKGDAVTKQRNWPEYNESLVKRGEMYLTFDFLESWERNLEELMREKWKVHRGWIKVHLAVDVKTKEIVAIEVTDERVSDGSRFNSLVDQAEENLSERKIEKALGDGAFDRREIFDHLQEKQIQPVMKTRSNANTKARGSPARAKAVKEMKALGYESIRVSALEGEVRLWEEMGSRNCLLSGEKNIRRACSRNRDGEYDARGHSKIHFYNMMTH